MHLSLLITRTKIITSTSTDWLTWDNRKDFRPDKTALLAWCQAFETALIPCLINEPHVGDSSLLRSRGLFLPQSLFPSLRLVIERLKWLNRGNLELLNNWRRFPCLKVNQLRSLFKNWTRDRQNWGPSDPASSEWNGTLLWRWISVPWPLGEYLAEVTLDCQ